MFLIIKAEFMEPVFPTMTWPNHISLVTGKHSQGHQVIADTVYNVNLKVKMDFKGFISDTKLEFWNQIEPIWLTAKNKV
jgi:predicted AlkP superfamily pyrophosphatase or phosphodiesterase